MVQELKKEEKNDIFGFEYRGKPLAISGLFCKYNEPWVYGNLIIKDGMAFIGTYKAKSGRELQGLRTVRVDPKTVGVSWGEQDEGKQKLFTDDVVQIKPEIEEFGVIIWDKHTARFMVEGDGVVYDFDYLRGNDLIKLGNIHDNPEYDIRR